MTVDRSTTVLVILVVIIVVMVIGLILAIILFVTRRNHIEKGNIRQPFELYSYPEATPVSYKVRQSHTGHDSHLYSTPNTYPEHIPRSDVYIAETNLYSSPHEGYSPRISAISGTSVDIGNVRDVSGFFRDPPTSRQFLHPPERLSEAKKVDSMRSSMGVDLGGIIIKHGES